MLGVKILDEEVSSSLSLEAILKMEIVARKTLGAFRNHA